MAEQTETTTLATIPKIDEERVALAMVRLDRRVEEIEQITGMVGIVCNERTQADVSDAAKMAKELCTELEAMRDNAVRPLNEVVKKINALMKPRQDRATAVLDGLKKKLSDYAVSVARDKARKEQEERERLRAEEEARRQAEAPPAGTFFVMDEATTVLPEKAWENPPAEAPLETVSGTRSFGKATTTFVYTYEITDEEQIPRSFLMVNEALLKAEAKRKPKPREIAGVVWLQKARTSVR